MPLATSPKESTPEWKAPRKISGETTTRALGDSSSTATASRAYASRVAVLVSSRSSYTESARKAMA